MGDVAVDIKRNRGYMGDVPGVKERSLKGEIITCTTVSYKVVQEGNARNLTLR